MAMQILIRFHSELCAGFEYTNHIPAYVITYNPITKTWAPHRSFIFDPMTLYFPRTIAEKAAEFLNSSNVHPESDWGVYLKKLE